MMLLVLICPSVVSEATAEENIRSLITICAVAFDTTTRRKPPRGAVGRRWLWVFNGFGGRHEGGDGPVCLVGEEQCGWQRMIEVEDDRGWNRFWVRDKDFFRGQGVRGRIEPKDGSWFGVLGN